MESQTPTGGNPPDPQIWAGAPRQLAGASRRLGKTLVSTVRIVSCSDSLVYGQSVLYGQTDTVPRVGNVIPTHVRTVSTVRTATDTVPEYSTQHPDT